MEFKQLLHVVGGFPFPTFSDNDRYYGLMITYKIKDKFDLSCKIVKKEIERSIITLKLFKKSLHCI